MELTTPLRRNEPPVKVGQGCPYASRFCKVVWRLRLEICVLMRQRL